MSLKKFHIFFMLSVALFSGFCLYWGIDDISNTDIRKNIDISLILVGALGIPFVFAYLFVFLKKWQNFHLPIIALFFSLFSLWGEKTAQACSICYKDPSEPTVRATFIGVAFLAVVIVALLLAVLVIGRQWVKRARAMGREL